MKWQDQGTLLGVRPHGENAVIADVFTQTHGRHAGVVRGGAGRQMSPVLQPGAVLQLTWSARLEDHLGTFVVEPVRGRAGELLGDRLALAGLNAICALSIFSLLSMRCEPTLLRTTIQSMGLSPARARNCRAFQTISE